MIRAYFGISANPFNLDAIALLPHQQHIYDTLQVHSQQGGLCLVMGEPGTGKTVIKEAIRQKADKRMVVVSVNRTMHTYTNTLRILCAAFGIEHKGAHVTCEKRILEQAHTLNRSGKMLLSIIDEAHLMDIEVLRRLRLMFDEFPKNHNIILCGQPQLITHMALKPNEDIRSRITYSVMLKKLAPDDMERFILAQLDAVGLGHNTFTDEALSLVVRSADGIIRRTRNLCIAAMLEAVRDRKKIIDLDVINAVLIQPHWRNDHDMQS